MGPKNILLQVLLVHLVGLYGLQVYGDKVDITLAPQDFVDLHFPGNSTDRTWNVTGPTGSQVDLYCAQITLLESDDCTEGFLFFLDYAGEEKICKPNSPHTRVSIGNLMTIQFKIGPRGGGRLNCTVRLKKTGEDADETPSVSEAMDAGDYADVIAQDDKNTSSLCLGSSKKRIIGGQETKPNEYIFMAYLQSSGNPAFCGGTILTKRHILTAAHCIEDEEPGELQVVVGGHDTKTDWDKLVAQTLNVSEMLPHERSFLEIDRYDIALLALKEDILFNPFVKRVYLPSMRYQLVNNYVTAIGWGDTNMPSTCSSTCLRSVSLKVIELVTCYYKLMNIESVDLDRPTQICTFSPGKGTGPGDCGGPMLYRRPGTNQYVQVAIIGGSGGLSKKQPDVNIEVFPFIGWIEGKIKQYDPHFTLKKL